MNFIYYLLFLLFIISQEAQDTAQGSSGQSIVAFHELRSDRYNRGLRRFLHVLRRDGRARLPTLHVVEPEILVGLHSRERFAGQFRAGMDVRAAQDSRVHMPHGLLRQYSDRPGGRRDDLQNAAQLPLPTGNEQLGTELWDNFRVGGRVRRLLRPLHGRDPPHLSPPRPMVAARYTVRVDHFHLRRIEEALGEEESRGMVGSRDLLLKINKCIYTFHYIERIFQYPRIYIYKTI